MQGKIIVFWGHRHYGFIGDLDSANEYFFHTEDLAPNSAPPAKGLPVAFDTGQWKGRPKAINVRVLSSASEILGGEPGVTHTTTRAKEKTSIGPDALPHTKEVLGGGM
jgi:cold shock CspA family protein